MDVDRPEGGYDAEQGERYGVGQDDVIQDEGEDDEEGGEGEEVEDKMAIEEEELRKDARGLDESAAGKKEWRAKTERELA